MKDITVIKGSVLDAAREGGITLADAMMQAKVIVVVDWSGSMGAFDVDHNGHLVSRYDAAQLQLTDLQGEYPGEVVVVAFADGAEFIPSGDPENCTIGGGGTNMLSALEFIEIADDTGIKFFIVTDGDFTSDHYDTMDKAETFKTPLHGIYVGPEGGRGLSTLQEMCARSGGKAVGSDETGVFLQEARKLLTSNGN